MKTSPLTNAVALAAFGAAAAAQDGAAERAENSEEVAVDFSSVSVDCAEECVFQGFEFTGENWRIEAGEARAREIDAVGDGEVRLRDVRFEFEDILLNVPSAVFQFANDAIVRAELTGEEVQLETDGARFTAQSIVFTFVDEEPATVELSGEPALFEDLSAERPRRRTASAGTMFYDYRERELRALGETTYRQEGRLELRCVEGLSYDLDTGGFRSGECEGAGVLGGRDSAAPTQGSDPAPESAP